MKMADPKETKATTFSLPTANKKVSLSLGGRPAKRSFAAIQHEDEDQPQSRDISTFGERAEETSKPTARVIPSIPNANWQDPHGRKQTHSPVPAQDKVAPEPAAQSDLNITPQYGLNRPRARSTEEGEDVKQARSSRPPSPPKTADEEAFEALTGSRKPQGKTITPASEDEAFRDSYDEAPGGPTAEDYAATPVEGFGAAILRGYLKGGKSLEDHGYNEDGPDEPRKKRPGLLGLGAKESGTGVELGAWGKAARDTAPFMPLSRKNKKTGEVLGEEELKDKLRRQQEQGKQQSYVNGRPHREPERRDDRRRDPSRDDDRQREPRRIEDRRRDRSREGERRRDRSRDDRERHRRRDREKDYGDRHEHRRHDRPRSPSSRHRRR